MADVAGDKPRIPAVTPSFNQGDLTDDRALACSDQHDLG